MATITKDQFDQVIDTFTLDKVCSFKADKDSDEQKTVTLRVKYQGATIRSLAQSTLGQGVVVKWQNGRARKDYTKIADRSVVEIDWSAPATAPQVDPKTAMLMEAKADGVDIHDKKAMEAWVSKKYLNDIS